MLLILKLAYNLLSVSKATETGKTFKFNASGYEILNASNKCIAFATKMGSLYYLKFSTDQQQLNEQAEATKRCCGTAAMDISARKTSRSWLERD